MTDEGGVPLLTFPDGTDSFGVGNKLETLHQLKQLHMFVTFMFIISVFSSILAWGAVDKDPTSAPFTHYHWFTLALPTLGVFVFGLMLHAWAHNMLRSVRALLFTVTIIYGVMLTGLFIFTLIERFILCKNGPPWKAWCTNGAAAPIDWEYDWYMWSILVQLILLIVEAVIYRRISKRVSALIDARGGMTHEQVVRELYSSHGPRYLTSIGTTLADVTKLN